MNRNDDDIPEWKKDWRDRRRYLNPPKVEPGDSNYQIYLKSSGTYIDDLTMVFMAVLLIVALIMLLPLVVFALILDWRDTYETVKSLWSHHVVRKRNDRQ